MLQVLSAALLVSACVAPCVVQAARRAGLAKAPTESRHVHTRPVPRLGGIAVYAGTVAAVLLGLWSGGGALTSERSGFFAALLLGGTVLFLTGLVDDLIGMRPIVKLGLQGVAAAAAYLTGQRIDLVSFGPHATLSLGMLSFPLTMLWIVGVTNAFNLIDGLDGLATGIALVVLATVTAAATLLHNGDVVLVSVALLGALFGFLRYNLTPARLFLGDSGSLFVGFMLAMLSLHGALKSATTVLIAVPVFALAVPLLDVALAIARRWLRGAPIFGADARHIHHRLLAIGLAPWSAATVLCALAAVFAAFGLSLAFAPAPAVLAISLLGAIATLVLAWLGIRRLDYHEFTEAGRVITGGLGRARRAMHDQIHARETAQALASATSLAALNAVLATRAPDFGFRMLEVRREQAHHDVPVLPDGERRPVRPWKLEFPVTPHEYEDANPLVLCVWCDLHTGVRPQAAERFARVVGPVVEAWIRTTLCPSVVTAEQAVWPALADWPVRSPVVARELADVGPLAPAWAYTPTTPGGLSRRHESLDTTQAA